MRIKLFVIAIATVATAGASVPAQAHQDPFTRNTTLGQQALSDAQYRKAQTYLIKALKNAKGQDEVAIARARTQLSRAYRGQGRFLAALEEIERALEYYNQLGYAEPGFVQEYRELSLHIRNGDLDRLGRPSSNALKEANARLILARAGDGAYVEIDMPVRMEKPLNSRKVDGIALERKVSFTMVCQPDGAIRLSNIRGFKIHSVENKVWANLHDLVVRNGPDEEGRRDARITAGKAGIIRVVDAKLPREAYEPIGALAAQITGLSAGLSPALPLMSPASLADDARPSLDDSDAIGVRSVCGEDAAPKNDDVLTTPGQTVSGDELTENAARRRSDGAQPISEVLNSRLLPEPSPEPVPEQR